MKYLYKLAFILVFGAGFALAQTGAGQDQQSTPSTPSTQQPGAQTPDNSQMGQSGNSSAATATKAQSDIQSALRKQLPASADNVTVSTTSDNKIQLTGNVGSDAEKTQVEQIARSAAPNVDIDNKLNVSSSPNAPGAMPPAGSQPPSSSKPPVLRLVAWQQSGSQDQQNPSNSTPGAGANGGATGQTAAPSAATSQTGDMNANSGDVQDKIQKAIQQDSSLSGANVNVNVSGNKVELTGTVASKDQKKTARQIAESNAGGMKVVDHLKVSGSETSPSAPPKN